MGSNRRWTARRGPVLGGRLRPDHAVQVDRVPAELAVVDKSSLRFVRYCDDFMCFIVFNYTSPSSLLPVRLSRWTRLKKNPYARYAGHFILPRRLVVAGSLFLWHKSCEDNSLCATPRNKYRIYIIHDSHSRGRGRGTRWWNPTWILFQCTCTWASHWSCNASEVFYPVVTGKERISRVKHVSSVYTSYVSG